MAPTGPDVFPDPQSALTVNNSLIGTGVAPTAGGNNVVTNNPLLGPLADNGGPTLTQAPLLGSLAVGAGDPAIVFNPAEFDQRGGPFYVRVVGGRVDVGAIESGQPGQLVVGTALDEQDGAYGLGDLSLREALQIANARLGADTITFAPWLSGQTITLGGTQLEVTDAVTVDARPLAHNVTVDANLLSRALRVDDPSTATESFAVTLAGLNFVNGRTAGPSSTPRSGCTASTGRPPWPSTTTAAPAARRGSSGPLPPAGPTSSKSATLRTTVRGPTRSP